MPWHRSIVRVCVLTALSSPSVARAAPADPFAMGVPARDSAAPDGESLAGTNDVDLQTGSARYSIPIAVPPGRLDQAPHLALTYSSAGALRGGVAVGWSLDLPSIELDPDDPSGQSFRGGLGNARLIHFPGLTGPLSTAQQFRAENDREFTRYVYEPTSATWTAYTLSGQVFQFSASVQRSRWHLTASTDAQGNRIDYRWTLVTTATGDQEQLLTAIEYTSNPRLGIEAHARVELVYAPIASCSNGAIPGAATDHRFGRSRIRGSRTLTAIQTDVRDQPGDGWRRVRSYTLRYDTAELGCDASALRYLTSLEELAFDANGFVTWLPPVRFHYGATTRDLSTTLTAVTPTEHGTAFGPSSMLVDFDGDGWIDDVRMEQGARCVLAVRPGTGVLQFAGDSAIRRYPLPSAAWLADDSPSPGEGCTLSGQIVRRLPESFGTTCRYRQVAVSYHLLDWDADGRLDVVSQLAESAPGLAGGDFTSSLLREDDEDPLGHCDHRLDVRITVRWNESICNLCPSGTAWDPFFGRCEPTCFGSCPPSLPSGDTSVDGGNSCVTPPIASERNLDGNAFVLHVNRNLGASLAAPVIVTSPVELAPNPTSVTPIVGPWLAELSSLVDIDGDGWLDAVSLHAEPSLEFLPEVRWGEATTLFVWRGNGAGFGARESWPLPTWSQARHEPTWNGSTGQFLGPDALRLADVDGDGLPDLVAQLGENELVGANQIAVAFNLGSGFARMIPTGIAGPIELRRTDTGEVGTTPPPFMYSGERATIRDLVDLDRDGQPELFWTTRLTGQPLTVTPSRRQAMKLHGRPGVAATIDLPSAWDVGEANIVAREYAWLRTAAWLDVTGDGALDAVTWSGLPGAPSAAARVQTDAVPGQALGHRLLVRIDNGRGGTTEFVYRPTTASDVVDLAGAQLSPRPVVWRTSSSGGAGPSVSTTLHYARPLHGHTSSRDVGPQHFLGFAEVTSAASGPQGWDSRRTTHRFTATPLDTDSTPREIEVVEEIKDAAGVHHPTTIRTQAWTHFADVAGVTVPTVEVVATCAANASETSCRTAPSAAFTTTKIWQRFGDVTVHGASQIVLRELVEQAAGDPRARYTRTSMTIAPAWMTGWPQLLATGTERGVRAGGVETPLEAASVEFDVRGRAIRTSVRIDATQVAQRFHRFTETGQVAWTEAANEAGGPLARTVFEYDPRELYAIVTIDPLKHRTESSFDVASGAQRSQLGPDVFVTCGLGVCVSSTTRWERDIDGLGRTAREYRLVDDPTVVGGVHLRLASWSSYSIGPGLVRTIATRVTDHATGATVEEETRYDGLGRVIAQLARHTQGGQADREVRFEYDSAGKLAAQLVPDPRAALASAPPVAYRWARDGLSRVLRTERPDGSGDDLHYDGVTTTIVERDNPSTVTTLVHDATGNLVEVREAEPGGPAVTRYEYDVIGRRTMMVDAAGEKTTFAYDGRGLRTAITSDHRRWEYRYDLSGKLVAAVAPHEPWEDPVAYTTTSTYDLLGRLVTRVPASLGRSADEQRALGIGPEQHSYTGLHETSVAMPAGTRSTDYDVEGRPIRMRQQLAVPGTGVVSDQTVELELDALGTPRQETWDNGTRWRYSYDDLGQLAEVTWHDPATQTSRTLASYRRNPAGKAIVRSSDLGVSRTWKYDERGRPVVDSVMDASGNELAMRSYGYDGDEVSAVWGHVAQKVSEATYAYDTRHRLISAIGPGTYEAALTYGPTGDVLSAVVRGVDDQPDRAVAYDYQGAFPQAVTRLRDLATGGEVATLDYDLRGNLTQRRTADGEVSLGWDADGQLRAAVSKAGDVRYLYGRRGERLARIDRDSVTVWFGASETHYQLDGTQVRRWHHIVAGERLARIENGTDVELEHADGLGNLWLTTDAGGKLTSQFHYGAFGEIVGGEDGGDHRRQFNGKEGDPVTGLRHYGFRSYDPLLLRWTSADPMYRFAPDLAPAEPARANLYAFSLNNPVRWVDPDGLDSEDEELSVIIYSDNDPRWEEGANGIHVDVRGGNTEEFVDNLLAEIEARGGHVTAVVVVGHGLRGQQQLHHQRELRLDHSSPALEKLRGKVDRLYLLGCHAGFGINGNALLEAVATATGADVFAFTGDTAPKLFSGAGAMVRRRPGEHLKDHEVIVEQLRWLLVAPQGLKEFDISVEQAQKEGIQWLMYEAEDKSLIRLVNNRLTPLERLRIRHILGTR